MFGLKPNHFIIRTLYKNISHRTFIILILRLKKFKKIKVINKYKLGQKFYWIKWENLFYTILLN